MPVAWPRLAVTAALVAACITASSLPYAEAAAAAASCQPGGGGTQQAYDVYQHWVVQDVVCNWCAYVERSVRLHRSAGARRRNTVPLLVSHL